MKAITLTLPWDVLVPDNRKHTVARGQIILTAEYRMAKEAIGFHALAAMKQSKREKLSGRVMLEAVVYEPNRSRTRDVSNFAKLVCDGLSGVCYDDDGQIDDARWIRGGISKQRPRMELTLTPLTLP